MKSTKYAMIAAVALGLSACSAQATDTGSNAEAGTQTVKVGVIPTADYAPLYIAEEKGYFEAEGLNVEIQTMQSFSAMTPSVLNGQLQLGTGATHPFVTAVDQGLPLVAVANSSRILPGPENDVSALMVGTDSDIDSLADLAGKTVAVNAINSIVHVLAVTSLQEAGVDPASVKFAPMGYPEMYPAMEQGSVDAVAVFEPFVTIGKESGARTLDNPIATSYPDGASMGTYFTSQDFAAKNDPTLQAFTRALDKGVDDAAADSTLVRKLLVEEAKMDQAIVDKMQLPDFSSVKETVDTDTIQRTSELMAENGFIKQAIDVSEATWPRP